MKSILLAAAAALTLAAAPRGFADVGEPEAPAPRQHVYREDRYYAEPRPVYREEVRVYRYYRPVAVYPAPICYPRPVYYTPRVHFLPPPPPPGVHFFFRF